MKKSIKKLIRYLTASLVSLLFFGSILHVLTPMVSADADTIYGRCGESSQPRGELTPPCCAQNNHTANNNAADLVVGHGLGLIGGFDGCDKPQFVENIRGQKTLSHKISFQKTIVLRI